MADADQSQVQRFRFRRRDRIVLQREFSSVFHDRCSVSNDLLVVYVSPNGLTWSRLGISVSRRVGNAVRRNYAKRRIREAFRTRRPDIPSGYDFVFVAKPSMGRQGAVMPDAVGELSREVVRKLLRRTKVGKPESRSSSSS